ncbi:MAG: hypothetical protein AAF698_04585 [Pseudomonadota bacterium]
MSDESVTREACLAAARAAEAPLSEDCITLLGDGVPWLTERGEGALILVGVLGLVFLGYLLLESRQAARARMKRIRAPKD